MEAMVIDQKESMANVEPLYGKDTNLAQTVHMRLDASMINPKTNRRAPAGCKL